MLPALIFVEQTGIALLVAMFRPGVVGATHLDHFIANHIEAVQSDPARGGNAFGILTFILAEIGRSWIA